jgi:hypothetical protein
LVIGALSAAGSHAAVQRLLYFSTLTVFRYPFGSGGNFAVHQSLYPKSAEKESEAKTDRAAAGKLRQLLKILISALALHCGRRTAKTACIKRNSFPLRAGGFVFDLRQMSFMNGGVYLFPHVLKAVPTELDDLFDRQNSKQSEDKNEFFLKSPPARLAQRLRSDHADRQIRF